MSLLHLFTGGVGAALGHVGVAWVKGHFKAGEIASVEDAVVARASYAHHADWEHLALTLVLLILMLATHTPWASHLLQDPETFQKPLESAFMASVGWFVGRRLPLGGKS